MPTKKKKPSRVGKNNPHYQRDRLKRVWSKLVDVVGDSPEDLEMLRDFLDDLLDEYAQTGLFGDFGGQDPRRNGKSSEIKIY